MAKELPYLPSYKNVGKLFQKIRTAKVPDTFTTRYLSETLGLKASADRALIAILKSLGFLDSAARPTESYGTLKNETIAPQALAQGIRLAYAPLFEANEKVNELSRSELNGLVAQVAGADNNMTGKIAGTFVALCSVADFSKTSVPANPGLSPEVGEDQTTLGNPSKDEAGQPMRPEFHYNIQIHLPSNGTEQTYTDIFNALRKVFR
jgi:hypothetical protein